MSSSGAVTLDDLAGKLPMLDVACSKCDRRGRLRVAKLIAAPLLLPHLVNNTCEDATGVSINWTSDGFFELPNSIPLSEVMIGQHQY